MPVQPFFQMEAVRLGYAAMLQKKTTIETIHHGY
jgi:hypothetical protein